MVTKIWSFIKGLPGIVWEVLVVIGSVFVAYLSIRSKDEAQTQVRDANDDKANAVLQAQEADIKKQDAQVVADGEAQKAAIPTDPEQLAKDLNNV